MKAEIIAIGSELLSPFRQDTNSLYLTRSLEEHGIRVIAKTIIGDDISDLVNVFRIAFERADVIICSGGLGPTIDDLTRDALSEFLQIPLELHEDILAGIRARFEKRGMRMPEVNRKQAMVLAGGTALPNPNGTAPGQFIEVRGKQVFLLPGPPPELEPMWQQTALPLLKKAGKFQRTVFRIAMLPESQVDEMVAPATSRLMDVRYTILAAPSDIEIHLLAPETAVDELISASAEIRSILGAHIYSDSLETMEEVVGRMLKKSGRTLATAESCTGGMVAHRITQVPGSSAYFKRGLVVYSNESKMDLLAVPATLLEQHGAVSEPVAAFMAEAIRKTAQSDYGIGITGIAGPDGGTPEKPVGLVYVALADDRETQVRKYSFPGKRDRIKFSAGHAALNLLRLKFL